MGATLAVLEELRAQGLLTKGSAILDFGPSNLYSASQQGIRDFARAYDVKIDDQIVRRLAEGSAYYGTNATPNESFAGELLERVGITYYSIDIAKGYRTTIVDLNRQPLPENFVGAFDTVMNLGTTEHIINQMACFRAIHDATKVGGHMVHQLPSVGFVDHCYFTYTGRFFFDLAVQNDYELVAFAWSHEDRSVKDLFSWLAWFRKAFPVVDAYVKNDLDEAQGVIRSIRVPSVLAKVVFRKKSDRPFLPSLECTTSVGVIPTEVFDRYEVSNYKRVSGWILLREIGQRALRRIGLSFAS
jgi:hypothetical protein